MTLREIDGQNALADSLLRERAAARRLPNHTVSELLVPLSGAIDLAEGRTPGHAQRVAYIAAAIAAGLGLESNLRLATCYAGLLHDIGVIAAGARLGGYIRGDERRLFAALPLLSPAEVALGASVEPEAVIESLLEHAVQGGHFAHNLGLPVEAVRGISAHHESWDGSGYPEGISGQAVPVVGRVVALADQVESLISQASPLQARRNLQFWLAPLSGSLADPESVQTLRELSSSDSFWLGLFSPNLPGELANLCSRLREQKATRVLPFAESFSRLVDSRFSFTGGISLKVACLSEELGRAAGLSEQRLRLLRIAALLHDAGQLCVSERIMAKPGILSVEELDILRLHPQYSSDIVAGIAGLDEVASWVAAHHERPDGKGYPEGLAGDQIPFEARILAVVDTYVALTSERPHRPRLLPPDALRRLRPAAGGQLDACLVELFTEKVVV